jgi:hypothetical protein
MSFEDMEPDNYTKHLLPWKRLPGDHSGEPLERRLIDEYSKRLADPNLSASERAKVEQNLKKLRKQIGDED